LDLLTSYTQTCDIRIVKRRWDFNDKPKIVNEKKQQAVIFQKDFSKSQER
jgi:hypothetical protein